MIWPQLSLKICGSTHRTLKKLYAFGRIWWRWLLTLTALPPSSWRSGILRGLGAREGRRWISSESCWDRQALSECDRWPGLRCLVRMWSQQISWVVAEGFLQFSISCPALGQLYFPLCSFVSDVRPTDTINLCSQRLSSICSKQSWQLAISFLYFVRNTLFTYTFRQHVSARDTCLSPLHTGGCLCWFLSGPGSGIPFHHSGIKPESGFH